MPTPSALSVSRAYSISRKADRFLDVSEPHAPGGEHEHRRRDPIAVHGIERPRLRPACNGFPQSGRPVLAHSRVALRVEEHRWKVMMMQVDPAPGSRPL